MNAKLIGTVEVKSLRLRYVSFAPRGFRNEVTLFSVPAKGAEDAVYGTKVWGCADIVPGSECWFTTRKAVDKYLRENPRAVVHDWADRDTVVSAAFRELEQVSYDWDGRLEAMAAAEEEADAEAEEQALEYQGALLAFEDAVRDSEVVGNVQSAFSDLLSVASGNPAGQDIIREAEEVLERSKWALDDTKLTVVEKSLDDRIEVANLVLADEGNDERSIPAVWFDVIADGKVVLKRVLEWLDEDGDIVELSARNNYRWPENFRAVADALGEDYVTATHEAIIKRLEAALAQLPTPPEGPKGGDDEDESELLIAEIPAALLPAPTLFLGVAKVNKNGAVGEPSVVAFVNEFTPEVWPERGEDGKPTGNWAYATAAGAFTFGRECRAAAISEAVACLKRDGWKESRAEAEADAAERQRERLEAKAPHNSVVRPSKTLTAAIAKCPPPAPAPAPEPEAAAHASPATVSVWQQLHECAVEELYEKKFGPRNFLKACKDVFAYQEENVRCYGNIGCGRTFLEVDGERFDQNAAAGFLTDVEFYGTDRAMKSLMKALEARRQLGNAVSAAAAWDGKNIDNLVAMLDRVKWLEELAGKPFSSTRDRIIDGIRRQSADDVRRVQKSIDVLDPYTYHVHVVDENGDAMVSSTVWSFHGFRVLRASERWSNAA